MPQLDFVSFHYIINTFSFSYLFVYILATLFLLKPIFKEFFLFYKYPSTVFFGAMLLVSLYSEKVLFTALPNTAPNLCDLRSRVRRRWDWYKYIPRKKEFLDARGLFW